MRRANNESGLLGFCRKLSRDVLQFANPLKSSSGGTTSRDAHVRRRALQIESLEIRNYLSGTGIAASVDSVWFQEVAGASHNHAGVASWTAESISNVQQKATASVGSDTYDWIVQFNTQNVSGIANIAQTAALLAGGGIQFEAICGLGIVGQVLVRSSGASLDTVEHWLAADSDVAGFEQDAVRQIESTSNDTSLSQLWGLSKIDAYGAWNLSTGATGSNRVVIAEIDTGVDYTHPDLAANIWTNPNASDAAFGYDLHGYDFANNDSDPMDDNSHGTHVAGILGAVGNNSRGIAGVNWAVSIMPLKFMTSTGSGYLSDAIRAINYATMQRTQYGVNVRVINASWGGGSYSTAMQSAIEAAGNAGIMFVVAAGNDAANNDVTPHYPSNYNCTNIVSVAATDRNDQLASFSCYGASTVDIAAPGVSIYSTLPNNKYGMLSGTSMATPYVAGAAALAWAYDPTATLEEVRNALLQGVDHLSTLNGKVASGGRLDVLQTLKLLGAAPVAPTIGSLAVSANNVTAGASVKLVAAGATATSGSVTAVYFYADSNNNGVYDSTDTLIGTNNVVSGGSASLQLNTTGMSAGTYRYFARALGSNNQLSNAVSTTLTIAAGYSQNTTPSTPTIVVGAKLAGKIDTGGKECLYQFQAVAGTTYTIRTELVTLRDSVLYLYGTDGKTKLAFNDDGDSGMASRIIWTAPQSGTYYFKVAGFSKSLTGDFKVSLAANTTTASSAGVASLRSCSGETGVFASSNTIISPATSANFAQSANLASRLSANTVISDASALSGMRTVAPIYGATSTIISGTLFTGDLPAAQNDTISSTGRSEERTTSLLDSNPALRSVLGSMFFEEEPDAAATAESTDIDLDALDTLFAQLTEGDFGGNG